MAYIIAGCKAEKTFKKLEITVKSTIESVFIPSTYSLSMKLISLFSFSDFGFLEKLAFGKKLLIKFPNKSPMAIAKQIIIGKNILLTFIHFVFCQGLSRIYY